MRMIRILAVASAIATLAGCSRKPAPEPPVATPGVTLSRGKAPLGSPIDITYRFEVATSAPAFTENLRVFVGVVDTDEQLMWTDDHDPPSPTTTWKPGEKIEYTRTVFIPVYPYIGDATIHMGLYSPKTKKRASLAGIDAGQRAYTVATLHLLPQTESVFTVYKDGWHNPETPPDNQLVEWRWTKKEASLGFKNPKRDSLLYLDLDNPSRTFPEGQHVQLMLNGQLADEFMVMPEQRALRKLKMTAAQLGAEETVELRFLTDKTFVPAMQAGSTNRDPRELGIRIFHAFVEPTT